MSAATAEDQGRNDVNAIIPLEDINGPELKDISIERSQFGRADSLRYAILNLVVDNAYEAAVKELRLYQASKGDYPLFEERTERFIGYATDLINAIKSKRNFPGSDMLRQAKRQELNERVHEHFQELKLILDKIEKIEVELRVEDLRSTVWILQTISYCMAVLFAVIILRDIYLGNLISSLYITANDFYNFLTDLLVGAA